MTTALEQLIETILQDTNPERYELFGLAGFFFEKFGGHGKHDTPAQQAENLAWPRAVIETPIDGTAAERLRDVLVQVLETPLSEQEVISATWALSKLCDPSTKKILVRVLQEQVQSQASAAIFQTMIALSNLGEDVFEGARAMSALDVDVNYECAARYLQRQLNNV